MGDYYDDRDRGSRYDEPPRRYKSSRTRPRGSDDPDFIEETTFIERGKGRPPQELVPRGRDRDDSVEDIQRDFSPPGGRRPSGYGDYGAPPRRAKSMASRRSRYDDDDYDDYGPAAGGAAAGYAAGRRSRNDGRRRGRDSYSDDDRSPPRKPERKKSGIESTLEGLGLGGVAGALLGKDKDKDSRSRSRSRGGGRSQSRPRGKDKQREWAQAAQAALIAGAVEAFKSRKEEGPWTGDKGKRIATAAIGAGGIDKLVDRDPNDKSKRHLVEAVLGGLAANRLANGPVRSKSQTRNGSSDRGRSGSRSRSRSQSRNVWSRYRSKSRGRRGSSNDEERGTTQSDKFKDLAAGGVLAGVGKQIYDRFRSKSRRRRSPSSSGSEDSYRSRSRRNERDVGSRSQSRGGPPDHGAVVGPRGRGGAVAAQGGDDMGAGGSRGQEGDDDNDTSDSEDLERKRKKMRGKEYLTAALASIATIHAAHGVYQSMEASDGRHKMVAEGEMSQQEARKKRSKAWLQDAAAVGIAALGIKGAYSEWKEMNEQRHELKGIEERKHARQQRQRKRIRDGQINGGYQNGGGGGPYMSGGASGGRTSRDDRYYNDGNPYGAKLPPPPVGYSR